MSSSPGGTGETHVRRRRDRKKKKAQQEALLMKEDGWDEGNAFYISKHSVNTGNEDDEEELIERVLDSSSGEDDQQNENYDDPSQQHSSSSIHKIIFFIILILIGGLVAIVFNPITTSISNPIEDTLNTRNVEQSAHFDDHKDDEPNFEEEYVKDAIFSPLASAVNDDNDILSEQQDHQEPVDEVKSDENKIIGDHDDIEQTGGISFLEKVADLFSEFLQESTLNEEEHNDGSPETLSQEDTHSGIAGVVSEQNANIVDTDVDIEAPIHEPILASLEEQSNEARIVEDEPNFPKEQVIETIETQIEEPLGIPIENDAETGKDSEDLLGRWTSWEPPQTETENQEESPANVFDHQSSYPDEISQLELNDENQYIQPNSDFLIDEQEDPIAKPEVNQPTDEIEPTNENMDNPTTENVFF